VTSTNVHPAQIKFPMQKLVIFRKVKKIKELCGGVQVVRRTSDSADWRRNCEKGLFL